MNVGVSKFGKSFGEEVCVGGAGEKHLFESRSRGNKGVEVAMRFPVLSRIEKETQFDAGLLPLL